MEGVVHPPHPTVPLLIVKTTLKAVVTNFNTATITLNVTSETSVLYRLFRAVQTQEMRDEASVV